LQKLEPPLLNPKQFELSKELGKESSVHSYGSRTTTINFPYAERKPCFKWKDSVTGKLRRKTNTIRVYYGQYGVLKNPISNREEAAKAASKEASEWLAECRRLGHPPGMEPKS
jgi:hypothetical protein